MTEPPFPLNLLGCVNKSEFRGHAPETLLCATVSAETDEIGRAYGEIMLREYKERGRPIWNSVPAIDPNGGPAKWYRVVDNSGNSVYKAVEFPFVEGFIYVVDGDADKPVVAESRQMPLPFISKPGGDHTGSV